MIVPMKKVSLIMLSGKREEALKKLRKLGLIHIEMGESFGEEIDFLKGNLSLIQNAIFNIGKSSANQKDVPYNQALEIANEISALTEENKAALNEVASLKTELERIKGWGEVEPESILALKQKGVNISLYEMPKNEYNTLSDDLTILPIQKNKQTVKFAVILKDETDKELIASLENYHFEFPQFSNSEIEQKISDLSAKISQNQEKINAFSSNFNALKNAEKSLLKQIEFQTVKLGMEDEILSESNDNNLSVAYFKGYIEAEKLEILSAAAKENSWGLISEDPTEEDNVPTKLKNNKFVSLIYPLTDFLGTVPGYFEYDISGWFLSFILIFFGIIFGDGGYGLLITAVAAVPVIKSLISKKTVSPVFLLVGLFGLSTILWGTLTCTWFGLSPEQLPAWLKALSVPVISNVYADKIWYPFWMNGTDGLTTAQNLQILCFTLALVQLTVAHIKGAARNIKSLKALGDIGSILQLIGIYYIVLSLVVNAKVFSFSLVLGPVSVGTLAIALIAVGFVLSFVFSNYEGSIIKSILSSLTNIVSVLLGVVNVFSDIVSYIRLWAVGLAGAAISATVNELAGPLLGNFMFMILAIVLLVFGHGLNMILNVLSVIVHGIRLNTLEFSSHLDMSWSGHKFKPFEE